MFTSSSWFAASAEDITSITFEQSYMVFLAAPLMLPPSSSSLVSKPNIPTHFHLAVMSQYPPTIHTYPLMGISQQQRQLPWEAHGLFTTPNLASHIPTQGYCPVTTVAVRRSWPVHQFLHDINTPTHTYYLTTRQEVMLTPSDIIRGSLGAPVTFVTLSLLLRAGNHRPAPVLGYKNI